MALNSRETWGMRPFNLTEVLKDGGRPAPKVIRIRHEENPRVYGSKAKSKELQNIDLYYQEVLEEAKNVLKVEFFQKGGEIPNNVDARHRLVDIILRIAIEHVEQRHAQDGAKKVIKTHKAQGMRRPVVNDKKPSPHRKEAIVSISRMLSELVTKGYGKRMLAAG